LAIAKGTEIAKRMMLAVLSGVFLDAANIPIYRTVPNAIEANRNGVLER
jgi:hypothetical protein